MKITSVTVKKIEKERNLAVDLLDLNPDLKIIDTAYVLETDYSPEELWLNPSSLLMMAQNVRLGLEEYIDSNVLKAEIDIKDHPELFSGLCAAKFTKGDYALVNRGFSLNGKDIYYLRAYLKDAEEHITFRISTMDSFSCVEYDDKSFYIDIDEKIVEYLRELIDEIGEYQ